MFPCQPESHRGATGRRHQAEIRQPDFAQVNGPGAGGIRRFFQFSIDPGGRRML